MPENDFTDAELWTLTGFRRKWSLVGGWQVIHAWEGPSEAYNTWLASIEPGYVELVQNTEVERLDTTGSTYEGHMRVDVIYQLDERSVPIGGSATGLVSRVWTQEGEEREIGPLQIDRVNLLRARDPGWVGRIVKNVDYWKLGVQRALEAGETPPVFDYSLQAAPANATAKEIIIAKLLADTLMDNPDVTRTITTPILQKVETLISSSQIRGAYENVDRLFTPATFIASEPTVQVAALINTKDIPNWLWLKQYPQVGPVSGGLWQITQRWIGVKDADAFMFDTPL